MKYFINGVLDVMEVSATAVGVTVVAPVALSTGYGLEAAGVTIVTVIVWLFIRTMIGEEEAEDYLADVKGEEHQER